MNRILRLALTCLLLAALPLQGYAAAGMLSCGAGAVVPHDHARHAADHQHDHPRQHAAAEPADADGALNLHDATHGTCSVCASCCSVAALPTAAVGSAAATLPAAPDVESAGAEAWRITTRLERPPRPHLV